MIFLQLIAAIIAGGICLGIVYLLIGDLAGAPFVTSDKAFLEKIFREAKFVKGKKFLDIGSGDGRVVRYAALKYGLVASGIELQPYLVWYSRWKSKNTYLRRNFLSGKLPEADYIYFYLFPGTVEKVGKKILAESMPGTLVISRAFEVKCLKNLLVKKTEEQGRKAFFYKI
jgi:hypothetical protein